MNIGQGRRAAQKRVTGGRWRRIVLGDVLAQHVVRVEEVVRVLTYTWPNFSRARSPVYRRGMHVVIPLRHTHFRGNTTITQYIAGFCGWGCGIGAPISPIFLMKLGLLTSMLTPKHPQKFRLREPN